MKTSPSGSAYLLLALVNLLPALALVQCAQSHPAQYIGGYLLLISIATALAYRADKIQSQQGDWRISESRLHSLELIGGWSAAFLAQRMLRHKTAKRSYQIKFWLIALLHQYIALDYLKDWQSSKTIQSIIQSLLP